MRRIKDLLRLSASGRSQREIARALGTANSTVSDYLTRARRAGVAWPEAAAWDDAALERALFPPPPNVPAESRGWPLTVPPNPSHPDVGGLAWWRELLKPVSRKRPHSVPTQLRAISCATSRHYRSPVDAKASTCESCNAPDSTQVSR